jgi:xylulokinase
MEYILAHDLGTSGNKASLYDRQGRVVASAFRGYDTYYPEPGWVEQEPESWWAAVVESTPQLFEQSGVKPGEVACVTFSGQMMGCVAVDGAGQPLQPALIWADQRGVAEAAALERALGLEFVYRTTGHRVSPTYSAEKIAWLKANRPRVYQEAAKFLHAKDFIVHRLTGAWATDYSDACGMNLFDLTKRRWSPEILQAAGIDPEKLPDPLPSTEVVGKVTGPAAEATGLATGTPVVIGGGDGSCAAAGAGVVRPGAAYNYIGSSSWIAIATTEPVFDPQARTFNWVHLDPAMYTPCGTMQAAGGSYAWAREVLGSVEVEVAAKLDLSAYDLLNLEAARVPPGSERLLFLPYLLGERSPHWNPYARGTFLGLTPRHSRAHLVRAVLEGVAFNLRIILEAFRAQVAIPALRVIGGGAKGALWRQILADVFQLPVHRLAFLDEATSLGAALAGGVGIGLFPDFSLAERLNPVVETAEPRAELAPEYDALFTVFQEAYAALVPVFTKLAEGREEGSP